MSNINRNDDSVQHGIDDNPNNDATKGAVAGGVGGAVVGGLAGGPIGAVVGAVAGAVASGVGVGAVDQVDNDNTITGIGNGSTPDVENSVAHAEARAKNEWNATEATPGNGVPGVQTGGQTTAGADTRGITEKAADAVTGDNVDDKTGGRTY